MLTKYGAQVEGNNISLAYAAEEGHSEVCTALLLLGADPDFSTNDYTPLGWASRKGHSEIVSKLLEHDANIDLTLSSDHLETPLWWASWAGYPSIVKILIENGANLDQHDGSVSPLKMAYFRRCQNIQKLLILAGAEFEHDYEELSQGYFERLQRQRKQQIPRTKFDAEVEMKLNSMKQLYADCLKNCTGLVASDDYLPDDMINLIVDFAIDDVRLSTKFFAGIPCNVKAVLKN